MTRLNRSVHAFSQGQAVGRCITIRRAEEAKERADLVLLVLDRSRNLTAAERGGTVGATVVAPAAATAAGIAPVVLPPGVDRPWAVAAADSA